MNRVLINYYAKLVRKGRCTIEQIPEDYRKDVQNFIDSKPTEAVVNDPVVSLPETTIYGALCLPKIEDCHIDTSELENGKYVEVYFSKSKIFNEDVLGEYPLPTDLSYSIDRVENVYGKFGDDLNVALAPSVDGFILEIYGRPVNVFTGNVILRVDLRIHSSNYEDMKLTIYFTA